MRAHHRIPVRVVRDHSDFFTDLANNSQDGWALDSEENLTALPFTIDKQNDILQATGERLPLHRSNHQEWSDGVDVRITDIEVRYNAGDISIDEALGEIRLLEGKLGNNLRGQETLR